MKLLGGLKLTTLSRLTWIVRLMCFSLTASSWLLFGAGWSVLLFALCSIVYCTTSYICYHPDARSWRDSLDSFYEALFVWTLNYKHTTTPTKPRATAGLVQDPPSPPRHAHTNKKTQVQSSVHCHKEAQKMIQLIMRDFIHKWYGDVTNDDEFPEDVQKILEHIALEINIRLQQIDLEEIVKEIATLVVPYLEAVNEAGARDFNGVNIFDVTNDKCQREFEANQAVSHRALQTSEHEIRYYRQALDAVILCVFPTDYKNCDVARMFVREILLQNVIEPVLDLLCDTDFLYESIPIILSKASPEKVERELNIIQHENEELEKRLSHGKLVVKIRVRQQNRRFHMSSNAFDSGPPSPVHRSRSKTHIPSSTSGSKSSHEHAARYLVRSLPPETIGVEETGGEFEQVNKEFEQVDSDLVYVQLAPIYIDRSVRVVSGTSNHTAYIFKFPKSLLRRGELEELGVLETDTHVEGMRRYSHFEKLHNALMNSSLSLYVKGLELPDKRGLSSLVSKLPFTNSEPDPTLILERKQGLEKYLQSISSVETVASSKEFHNFLKAGVKALKEANIVNPPKSAAKRKSFLSRVKAPTLATLGEDTLNAEPVSKRPFEDVVSAYLNTHLPLPCHTFNSLYSTHTRTNVAPPATVPAPPQPLTIPLGASPSQSLTSTSSIGHEREFPAVDESIDSYSEAAVEAIYDTPSEAPPKVAAANPSILLTTRQHSPVSYDDEEGQTTGMAYPTSIPNEQHTGTTTSQVSAQQEENTPPRPSSHNPLPERIQTLVSFLASHVKHYLSYLLSHVIRLSLLVIHIIMKGLSPLSSATTIGLAQEQKEKVPLANALLVLGSEVSRKHCQELWVCGENTQLAVLILVGGGMERFLWKELKEVVYCEQNWARALYHLRHTLWPEGKLMEGSKKKLSDQERTELKKNAAEAIKIFLPNFFPPIIGAMDYNKAVIHCLDCLQNPRLNRHFFLRVIDLLFMKMVPEINDKSFQRDLAKLRTLSQPLKNIKSRNTMGGWSA